MADLPDWFAASVIKGLYGTELKTIQVDELGRLYAILRALYGTTQKDVQCDASGNLTLNLKAQDLSEIINRPKYGAANFAGGEIVVTANAETLLTTVLGKGIIYSGSFFTAWTSSQENSNVRLYIDGTLISSPRWGGMFTWAQASIHNTVIYLLCYDSVNFKYSAAISPFITFETSVTLKYLERHGGTPTVNGGVWYALV